MLPEFELERELELELELERPRLLESEDDALERLLDELLLLREAVLELL
jgi:hypothetical protein